MREIKLRYILEMNGELKIVYIDLARLERSKELYHLFVQGWQIKDRNLFTGLLDKQGKEIYEGDCLKIWNLAYEHDSVVVVEYHAPSFKVYFLSAGNPHLIDWKNLRTLPGEVIGNIYENPELLRQENE